MPFRSDRLRTLRDAKNWSQGELGKQSGLSQSVIAKSENGKNLPGSDALDKLAQALDCTIDYLHGRGRQYESPTIAATHMAFDVFVAQQVLTDEQRERCRRALRHADAPKTAEAWRSFAEMLNLAIGPAPSSVSLALVEERRQKSKPMAVARRSHD
jgi:transcriptional regulator with XRE-family HTH domain